MPHQITATMKKSIRTAITIILFPLWIPIFLLLTAWAVAVEAAEITINNIFE